MISSVPLNVSFEETVYEVVESDGRVEMCVILTQPNYDIHEHSVNVEVFVDDNLIYYILGNINIASKLKFLLLPTICVMFISVNTPLP